MRDSTDPARKLHNLCDTRHGQSNMCIGLLSCFLRVTSDLMIVLFRVPPRQMQNCPILEVVHMDEPARMASWKEQTPALIGRGQSGPAPPFN